MDYQFDDPDKGTIAEINERREKLAEQGIQPVNLRILEGSEYKEKLIYPYALFHYGSRQVVVNLLEQQISGQMDDEQVLNNSIGLMEYKFSNAIQKLFMDRKPAIVFTAGQGELLPKETADLESNLRAFYNTGRIDLDSTYYIHPDIDLLVVAKPKRQFDERKKFLIDQYVMNGGKVLWLIDPLNATLDSMRFNGSFVPLPLDLNLDDLFFNYGFRLNTDLVLDLQCSRIPLQVGQVGNKPQLELFPWYYHPLVMPIGEHPIVKGLDLVNLKFPSTIDTIQTRRRVDKTIILASSNYSRRQMSPVRLNFEILRSEPDPA